MPKGPLSLPSHCLVCNAPALYSECVPDNDPIDQPGMLRRYECGALLAMWDEGGEIKRRVRLGCTAQFEAWLRSQV